MGELLQLSRRLFAHDIWADREFLSVVSELPEDHLSLDTGSSHQSVLGTMAHLLGSEEMRLSRFLGSPLDELPGIETYPDLGALRSGFEEFWPRLEFFLASLSEDQLLSELTWSDTRGDTFTRPLWQPLMHMLEHSTYHRGQLTTLLRQLGYQPPSTDLIHFLLRQ